MGLRLYLLRHGHSPSASEAGVSTDAQRPLSDKGRDGVKATISDLLKRGGKPALILHSPLLRAVQTSEIAEKLLSPSGGRRMFDPLSNVLPPEELRKTLVPELTKAGEVLAVGHQPQLGELAAMTGNAVFDLRPGGMVALEFAAAGDARAKVLWSSNPA
jgi:phosphohistidine phosphatase